MTERIARTEKRLDEGNRSPHEVAVTTAVTWIIPGDPDPDPGK